MWQGQMRAHSISSTWAEGLIVSYPFARTSNSDRGLEVLWVPGQAHRQQLPLLLLRQRRGEGKVHRRQV